MLIQISFRIMEIKYTLISLNVKERQKKVKKFSLKKLHKIKF